MHSSASRAIDGTNSVKRVCEEPNLVFISQARNEPSSLLKNLESGAFFVFLPGLRVGRSGCVRLLATVSRIVSGCGLRRQQFGNTNQIVGDQIEHEIGGDTGSAAMFGLAHRAVLLTPAEDAFGHRPARLRNAIAFVPRGASVDGALAALAG